MRKSNPVIHAIRNRRSVRGYQPGPVSAEQLEIIVDCGRLAPSALNEQIWEFIVITNPETLATLAALMPENGPFLADVPAAIATIGLKKHRSVYLDGAAATENMLLAAHALDLGACWIQTHEKEYIPSVMKLLKIPAKYTMISIISVGVPFGDVSMPEKRPLEAVLHWNKF